MAGDPLIGRQLANYRLERVIGRGGMAQVYYGWDIKLERPVAVKVIDARFRDNPDYAGRFVREAQAVSRWRHDHVTQVYYAGEDDGLYYFAMEYVDGEDLGQVLAAYRSRAEHPPAAEVLRVGWAVAGALDYAHARGVIHRDVKPPNIILAADGRVVLGDFGLALNIQQGSLGETFGSAHYIAPEQARRSAEAVPQSDLYALGVILYEMLAGRVPFDDPSPTSVAIQHITLAPPAPRQLNPALSPAVEAVLLKALAKAPLDRFQTGSGLMTALQGALNGVTIGAPGPEIVSPAAVESAPAPARAIGPSRTRWAFLALAAFALLLLVGISAGGVLLAARAIRPPAAVSTSLPGSATVAPATARLATEPPTSPAAVAAVSASPASASAVPPSEAATATVVPVSPTPVPPTPGTIAGVTPTVKYPNGRRFTVFYDENGLYLLNQSDSVISIFSVAFERLGASGESLNRFDGWRWAQFYPNSKPGWCMRIEILESPSYLRPPDCERGYLSTRTPTRDDPVVFWTTVPGSQEFRVLWRAGGGEEEVARCTIGAGRCEVYFP